MFCRTYALSFCAALGPLNLAASKWKPISLSINAFSAVMNVCLALLHPPVPGPLVFHPTPQRPGELGDQGVAVFFFERQQLLEAVVPGLSLERLPIGGFSGPENESNLNEIILRRVR